MFFVVTRALDCSVIVDREIHSDRENHVYQLKARDMTDAIEASGLSVVTALDGGAGSGETAQIILDSCPNIKRLQCFEPFPGNHKFWINTDPRITLQKSALDEVAGERSFYVDATVGKGVPGWENKEGYSSLGRLKHLSGKDRIYRYVRNILRRPETWYSVKTVRADEVLESAPEFIKLDLQGGELGALKGMSKWLTDVSILWIEYMGAVEVKNLLYENGFELFSTSLLFCDYWGDWHNEHLSLDVIKPASTGRKFHFGWPKAKWRDFDSEFEAMKQHGLMQTDLAAFNTKIFDAMKLKSIQLAL